MAQQLFDPTLKFVRVIEIKKNGMVEFEFSVGEPELLVELLLPADAFSEFCAANHVTTIEHVRSSTEAGAENEMGTPLTWNLHSARSKAAENK